jgi:uncharacterized protein (DUF2235 family)
MMQISVRENIAIRTMSQTMGITAHRVGDQIRAEGFRRGKDVNRVGAGVCGSLRRRGLIARVGRLWRLTKAGRQFEQAQASLAEL